jgi:hypothetical protein
MKKIIVIFLVLSGLSPIFGQTVNFRGNIEIGFVDVYSHTIRFGQGASGTDFDYVNSGGQDILFPFQRITADIEIGSHNIITLLYQPIDVRTTVPYSASFNMAGTTFPADSVLDLRYGFDFYRLSWMWDFFKETDRILGFGVSLQLRDAVINFATADGTVLVDQRDVGPVPALKFRYQENIGPVFWVGAEVDGIYANIKILNGSVENEITGSILDASLRAGAHISENMDIFLNYRFLGGGAAGTSIDEANDGDADDGFTDNQLALGTVTLGVTIK